MGNELANGIYRFIEPVLEQGAAMEKPPQAFLIQPGRNWPDSVPRPPEPMVFIPRIPDVLMRRVPRETMKEIEETARQVVSDMGLPQDATLAEVLEGKLTPRKPAAEAREPETRLPPVAPAKRSGFAGRMLSSAMLAGALAAGHGGMKSAAASYTPPARIFTMESLAAERRPGRRHGQREGVTLVEVLVVIAVVTVLAGLMLPAVQRVRDSAREVQFRNNMRQVGLAIQNFESAHNKLPYATSMVPGDKGTLIPHSWVLDILPYLEQEALYQKYDPRKLPRDQSEEVRTATVAALQHPAFPTEPGRMRMAALSSAGYSNTRQDLIGANLGISKDFLLSEQPGDREAALAPEWYMDAGNRWQKRGANTMASITDGTSNVPMVTAHLHQEGNRDPWLYDANNPGDTRITGLMFGTELGQSRVNGGLLGNSSQEGNFITEHVNGTGGLRRMDKNNLALFADGSVRPIANTGPAHVDWSQDASKLRFRSLVIKNDGNTPPDDLSR